MTAGQKLRVLRESMGLTIREVETATEFLAKKYDNEDYGIPLSRLSDIETKGIVPSIYRLYALAVVYRRDMRELLEIYGMDFSQVAADQAVLERPKTHRIGLLTSQREIQLPIKMDPAFDIKKTTNLGRMVERWGAMPFVFLQQLASSSHTYGYVGAEDFTMYPILLPGSFVQIDESRNKVTEGVWRSEYERPIYFVETREGYTCCWCSLKATQLVLQPHPLSPVQPRMVRDQRDAEVIGQVIAVAMRLDQWSPASAVKAGKTGRELN